MRTFDANTLAALALRQHIIRHFIWITPRDLTTGDLVAPTGYWTGEQAVTLNVVDGQSGSTVSRTYSGGGKIAALDQIVLETGIAVRTATVTLNMVDDAVNNLVRGYQLRKAPIEWHFGLFDAESRNIVATCFPLLVGMINRAPITTPARGGAGGCVLEIVSDSRKLTFVSGDKRSDENQQKRAAGDRFFKDAEIMGERELFWGLAKAAAGGSGGAQTGGKFGKFLNRGAQG